MIRDLGKMADRSFDVCIIGGGIYGACVAREASLCGLSVALVEKSDFASATSSNSLKIIHGGLRYLQHGDLIRMRESIRERRTWMRIAPHLVHPLPVLIPTYGHGMKGKGIMTLGLWANDLVGFDRNRLADRQKHIPGGRGLSRAAVINKLPGINPDGLTGGVVFHDAQVLNSERLVISVLQSACRNGAHVANYAKVVGLVRDGDDVRGVVVRDELTGEEISVRSGVTINTSGPWVNDVLGLFRRPAQSTGIRFAKALNVITRPLFTGFAVGVSEDRPYRDRDTLIPKGSRFLFITPWRSHSIIGTAYSAYDGSPDGFEPDMKDVDSFLKDINNTLPEARLTSKDVSFIHAGLLPMTGQDPVTGDIQLAKHSTVRDHRKDGLPGLISVTGVKYTTARNVAERTLSMVSELLGRSLPRSMSATDPVHGGQIEDFNGFMEEEMRHGPYRMPQDAFRDLITNYGSVYRDVLKYGGDERQGDENRRDPFSLLRAQVQYSVREEMAQSLSDVIFRRTDLGTSGHPGNEVLRFCSDAMGEELGWSSEMRRNEESLVNGAACYGNGR